jgi:hypothetical protein
MILGLRVYEFRVGGIIHCLVVLTRAPGLKTCLSRIRE